MQVWRIPLIADGLTEAYQPNKASIGDNIMAQKLSVSSHWDKIICEEFYLRKN